jgi:LPS-assembly lipoprotein
MGRRFAILAAASFSMAACNLQPLYGGRAGQQVSRTLATVEIYTPRNRIGQLLRVQLADELNPEGVTSPRQYDLLVRLDRFRDALAIQLDDTVTRYNLTLLATYELRRRTDNAVVFSSAARRIASYNVVEAPYATLAAEHDAERRAVEELAVEIRTRLSIVFAEAA